MVNGVVQRREVKGFVICLSAVDQEMNNAHHGDIWFKNQFFTGLLQSARSVTEEEEEEEDNDDENVGKSL